MCLALSDALSDESSPLYLQIPCGELAVVMHLLLASRRVVREQVAPLEEREEEFDRGCLIRVSCAEAYRDLESGYSIPRYLRGVVAGTIKQEDGVLPPARSLLG